MSFLDILITLFIGPLKLVFEIIFAIAHRFTGHPGLAIVVLSLIMNILVLPLYRRADAMQEEARDIDEKLRDGVEHIKKTFSGDERMMILQTYYRQNNYKPSQALNGSVSLLLEIPFFMAAYQFLSNLDVLNGVSFGPIADMGAPDGLLVIGGIAINLLPILMTLINVVSSAIYLKGFPLKTKIQLYAMAAFFLVFLYKSPACLVFYWTLNNIFSLVKNIFYKIKNPGKVINIILSVTGIAFIIFAAFIYSRESLIRNYFIAGIGCAAQMPIIISSLKKFLPVKKKEYIPNRKVFISGSIFITVLTGILIPSAYIAASPLEYVEVSNFYHPVLYIVNTLCMSAGTFIIWMGVFYWISNAKGKIVFEKLICILSGTMLVNYLFFGTELGNISSYLKYDNGLILSGKEQFINIIVLMALAVLICAILNKTKQKAVFVILTAAIAIMGMSVVNIKDINSSVEAVSEFCNAKSDAPEFNLSKTGKNVVVIMLDRAMGEYVPYIFNEKPELKEKFDGFTYYNNVISFGAHTNLGVPSLLGGYEYTPVEMNKRDQESLKEKHNEALKVMPAIFYENGYDVTVCDPPYAGYTWIPDLTIYDDYPEMNTYISKGKFNDGSNKYTIIESRKRNFFCFSVMKTMPLFVQPVIYDDGIYNSADSVDNIFYVYQVVEDINRAKGFQSSFVDQHNVLTNFSDITNIVNNKEGTFTFIANDLTHETALLQTPEYVPALVVDNTEYETNNADRFTVDGKILRMTSTAQMTHYHSNMAAYLRLADWMDYLRENNIYDNTRIIIASDHGYNLHHISGFEINEENFEYYYPLLMVKDFDSKGFEVSDEFMTNADVPSLAVKDLIDNPINPFTDQIISNSEKYAHKQYVSLSHDYSTESNNGNTYNASRWATVENDMRDINNWTIYEEEIVLKEYYQ